MYNSLLIKDFQLTAIKTLSGRGMRVIFFVVGFLLCSSGSFAQITSAQSGNWNDPLTWNGGIRPGIGDDVEILATHTVTLTSTEFCKNLQVDGAGSLLIQDQDFTVNGVSTISGSLTDNNDLGNNIFKGKVLLTSSGTWDTQLVSTASHNKFQSGIQNDNVGVNAFRAGAANLSNNQIFSGSLGSKLLFLNDVQLNDNSTFVTNQTQVEIGEKLNSLLLL
jgi:hypothetical protein